MLDQDLTGNKMWHEVLQLMEGDFAELSRVMQQIENTQTQADTT